MINVNIVYTGGNTPALFNIQNNNFFVSYEGQILDLHMRMGIVYHGVLA